MGITVSATSPVSPSLSGHAHFADAARMQPYRGGQHEIGPVGLEQVGRAHLGVETGGDQGHHFHERIGGLAAIHALKKAGDFA